MGWMGLWWVVGLILLVLVAYVLIRAAGRDRSVSDSPETILKRRYARGEIDRDEFERRLGHVRK